MKRPRMCFSEISHLGCLLKFFDIFSFFLNWTNTKDWSLKAISTFVITISALLVVTIETDRVLCEVRVEAEENVNPLNS